jgi:hypothetical protein
VNFLHEDEGGNSWYTEVIEGYSTLTQRQLVLMKRYLALTVRAETVCVFLFEPAEERRGGATQRNAAAGHVRVP